MCQGLCKTWAKMKTGVRGQVKRMAVKDLTIVSTERWDPESKTLKF